MTGFGTGLKLKLLGQIPNVDLQVAELTGFGTGLKHMLVFHGAFANAIVAELTGFGTGLKLQWATRPQLQQTGQVAELTGFGTGLKLWQLAHTLILQLVAELTGFGTGHNRRQKSEDRRQRTED